MARRKMKMTTNRRIPWKENKRQTTVMAMIRMTTKRKMSKKRMKMRNLLCLPQSSTATYEKKQTSTTASMQRECS